MGRIISSREFNQNPNKAKRAAEEGPLIVTDRGEPAYVLLRYDAYKRLAGERGPSLLKALRHDGPEADFEFTPVGTIGNSVLGWAIVMRKELHDGTTQGPDYPGRAS